MFWDRLYHLCTKNNFKPNTVAKAIGLSTATATKWKNGSVPNGEALSKIADYLDCSVDYLLGRTDTPQVVNLPEPLISTLLSEYSKNSDEFISDDFMYTAQNLVNNIKHIAKKKNILIRDILKDCGLSVNAINTISDKKGLSSFSLAKIADYLDVSVDYLLGRTDTPQVINFSDKGASMYNSQETANLIKSLANLKGISISKLLLDCELNKNALYTMQSKGYFLRVEAIAKIADYLDVSVDYLLGKTDIPQVINFPDRGVFMYNSSDIASRINYLLKVQNKFQKIMLENCGLNKNAISTMTARKSIPKADNLAKIADYLNCSVDYLLGRTNTPQVINFSDGGDAFLYISSNIAEKIKTMAKIKKIQIKDMLKDCELGKNSLSSMQSGGSIPKSDTLAKIADYLDVSVDYLLGKTDIPQVINFPDRGAFMYNSQETVNRIKFQAKKQNISINQLLSNCGLGKSTITKMSNGTDILTHNFLKIANYLDCSVDYLLGRTDTKRVVNIPDDVLDTIIAKYNEDKERK